MTYTEGFDQTTFKNTGLNYDATVHDLILIGEAATHIPESFRDANPSIRWRMIIATRNRLVHGYLGIDNDTLCSIIQKDVPFAFGWVDEAGILSRNWRWYLDFSKFGAFGFQELN